MVPKNQPTYLSRAGKLALVVTVLLVALAIAMPQHLALWAGLLVAVWVAALVITALLTVIAESEPAEEEHPEPVVQCAMDYPPEFFERRLS